MEDISVCLCGAGVCSTSETVELRAALKAAEERKSAINRRGFELYCADLDAGRELRPVEEYVLTAVGELSFDTALDVKGPF